MENYGDESKIQTILADPELIKKMYEKPSNKTFSAYFFPSSENYHLLYNLTDDETNALAVFASKQYHDKKQEIEANLKDCYNKKYDSKLFLTTVAIIILMVICIIIYYTTNVITASTSLFWGLLFVPLVIVGFPINIYCTGLVEEKSKAFERRILMI